MNKTATLPNWLPALLATMILSSPPATAQEPTGNRPERVEWLRDAGFGLFIHWSVDSQLGSVISHSLVGASDDYLDRYFTELPKTFNPKHFDPERWARIARLSGVKYVVFTAKHHSGFCMFGTKTTDFSITHTPYGKDVTAALVHELRKAGVKVGFYFSPDDFLFLHKQGKTISRRRPGVLPLDNPELLAHDRRQVTELLTQYGPIDVFFIDGPIHGRQDEGLKELCWKLQPEMVITRGAMETPEQYIPGTVLDAAWEACVTMGTQWQYKPTNDVYKSGGQLIEMLVETRAKGGNLLLNIGPHPDGSIPKEQEDRLREVALWNFINGEAIYGVRPWIVTNEENIWFTRKKDTDTVYAVVTGAPWKLGERKTLLLRSVRATDKTQVSVLGQNDKVLEYHPDVDPRTTWKQTDQGLSISVMRAQRIYNDRKWPNPIVLRIRHARAAFDPPAVVTKEALGSNKAGHVTLVGRLEKLGDADAVEVGFQYRPKKHVTQILEGDDPWRDVELTRRTSPGVFEATVTGLRRSAPYEFRAVVKHPAITLAGQTVEIPAVP